MAAPCRPMAVAAMPIRTSWAGVPGVDRATSHPTVKDTTRTSSTATTHWSPRDQPRPPDGCPARATLVPTATPTTYQPIATAVRAARDPSRVPPLRPRRTRLPVMTLANTPPRPRKPIASSAPEVVASSSTATRCRPGPVRPVGCLGGSSSMGSTIFPQRSPEIAPIAPVPPGEARNRAGLPNHRRLPWPGREGWQSGRMHGS